MMTARLLDNSKVPLNHLIQINGFGFDCTKHSNSLGVPELNSNTPLFV